MLWHPRSAVFLVSWLSVRPYTKSHYWRSFIRMVGGDLKCSLHLRSPPSILMIGGPLLFLLYINDFPLSVSCNTEFLADDSVLYRKITTEDDCVEFQDDLLSAAFWWDSWKVTLKSEKCKSLHVTKSKCPLVHQYAINDDNLLIVIKHKHLDWIFIEVGLPYQLHRG